jgi:hypothetical protein
MEGAMSLSAPLAPQFPDSLRLCLWVPSAGTFVGPSQNRVEDRSPARGPRTRRFPPSRLAGGNGFYVLDIDTSKRQRLSFSRKAGASLYPLVISSMPARTQRKKNSAA